MASLTPSLFSIQTPTLIRRLGNSVSTDLVRRVNAFPNSTGINLGIITHVDQPAVSKDILDISLKHPRPINHNYRLNGSEHQENKLLASHISGDQIRDFLHRQESSALELPASPSGSYTIQNPRLAKLFPGFSGKTASSSPFHFSGRSKNASPSPSPMMESFVGKPEEVQAVLTEQEEKLASRSVSASPTPSSSPLPSPVKEKDDKDWDAEFERFVGRADDKKSELARRKAEKQTYINNKFAHFMKSNPRPEDALEYLGQLEEEWKFKTHHSKSH